MHRGPKTLCTIHYFEWAKGALDLSGFGELPKAPINLKANIELNFLSSQRHKAEKEKEKKENLSQTKLLLEKRSATTKNSQKDETEENSKKVCKE